MSEVLRDKIGEVRSRGLTVAVGSGVGRVVVVLLGYLLVVMLLDFWLDLPMVVRAAGLVLTLAGCGYLVQRDVVSVVRVPPSDDSVALWIEADQPGLRQRLISAVQLQRDSGGASALMIERMTRETEELLAPADLTDAVESGPLYRWLGGGGGVVVVLLVSLLVGGATTRDLLLRAWCVPGVEVPRKTRIEVLTPADLIVARGDDVVLSARATGMVMDAGEVEVTYASGTAQAYALPRQSEPDPDSAPDPTGTASGGDIFAVTVRGVSEGFTYVVRLGDNSSEERTVRVSVRPVATQVEAFVTPPPYTRLPAARVPTGDLVLLEGSRLKLEVTASKPVRSTGAITGAGTGQNRVIALTAAAATRPSALTASRRVYALRRSETNPRQLVTTDGSNDGILLPRDTVGIAVVLVDEDGLETRDPTVYRVQVVPDRPPTVRVVAPVRKEEVITRTAVPRIGFEVSDDLAIGSLRIRYLVRAPSAERVGAAAAGGGGMVGGAPAAGLEVPPENAGGGSVPVVSAEDERNARTIELEVPANSKSLRGFYPWRVIALATGGLPEGSEVEWWLEAADTNNVTGPGVGRSERMLFRIGTEAQVRDALMARLTNSFGVLQETQQNQQDLTRDLGQLILEKPLSK